MAEPMEIYPMAMFPTLSVADIDVSVAWYTEKVGFGTVFSLPGPNGGTVMAHLRWRKYADLLLVPEAGPTKGRPARAPASRCRFWRMRSPSMTWRRSLRAAPWRLRKGPFRALGTCGTS